MEKFIMEMANYYRRKLRVGSNNWNKKLWATYIVNKKKYEEFFQIGSLYDLKNPDMNNTKHKLPWMFSKWINVEKIEENPFMSPAEFLSSSGKLFVCYIDLTKEPEEYYNKLSEEEE